jgi:hypothetical protein
MTYTISDKQFDKVTADVNSQMKNSAPDYNMQTNNCTTWAVNEAASVGIDLPQTKGHDAGGEGLDAGDLGQDLRDRGAQLNAELKKDGGSSGTGGSSGSSSSSSGASFTPTPHEDKPNN